MNPHKHLYAIERRNARLQVRALEIQIHAYERGWKTEQQFQKLLKMEEMHKGIIRAYNLNGEIQPVTTFDRWINFKTPGIYLRIPRRRTRNTILRVTQRHQQ
jgi:hypothetical protein